jgi:serine/threonine protein kinase
MLSIEELSQEGTLTRKGRIVGTPAYMAPEQITGVYVDVSADVYALGVMLYELLADRRPFLYERRSELLRAHLLEPVPKITEARRGLWVHPDLEALLLCSLAKDPVKRYPNARGMLDALRTLPPDAVHFDAKAERTTKRMRAGSSSAVISNSERQAVTQSAGMEVVGVVEPAPLMHSGTERDRPTHPGRAPARSSAATLVLFVLALLILGAAGVLWYVSMARP